MTFSSSRKTWWEGAETANWLKRLNTQRLTKTQWSEWSQIKWPNVESIGEKMKNTAHKVWKTSFENCAAYHLHLTGSLGLNGCDSRCQANQHMLASAWSAWKGRIYHVTTLATFKCILYILIQQSSAILPLPPLWGRGGKMAELVSWRKTSSRRARMENVHVAHVDYKCGWQTGHVVKKEVWKYVKMWKQLAATCTSEVPKQLPSGIRVRYPLSSIT